MNNINTMVAILIAWRVAKAKNSGSKKKRDHKQQSFGSLACL